MDIENYAGELVISAEECKEFFKAKTQKNRISQTLFFFLSGIPIIGITKAEEGLQTSDFRLQTSDFRLQTSDFRLQTSDFRLRTSDFTLRTSDFRLQTPNLIHSETSVIDSTLCCSCKRGYVSLS